MSKMDVDSSCASPSQANASGVFEYSHMMVPSTMRSRYWQYFGFPCDNYNNIVTKKKIICTLCNTAISYNKNTTNLRTHLVAKHPDVLYQLNNGKRIKLEDKSPDSSDDIIKPKIAKIRTISEKDFESLSHDVNEQNAIIEALVDNEIIENESDKINERNDFQDYNSSLDPQVYQVEEIDVAVTPSQELVTESLAQMLVKDTLPLSLVEGIGFTNFMFTIAPNITLPNREQVERNIKTTHEAVFNRQLKLIKNHTSKHPFSLGLELWSNLEQSTFINIYINLISEQKDILKNILFKTVNIHECTNLYVFDGINLANCTAAIFNCETDVFKDILKVHGVPKTRCFWSVIQNCLQKVFSVGDVENVIKDVQKYVNKAESMSQDDSIMPQVHDQFPMTKLNLLSHFYDKYSTAYSSWSEEMGEVLEKSKEISDCLSPLKVTLETLSDEQIAFYSLYKPLATKLLNEYFRVYEDDSPMIVHLKQIVSNELEECMNNKTFPILATFFDSRFLSFIDSDDIQMIKIVVDEKLKTAQDVGNGTQDENMKTFKRKSSLKMFFENDDIKRTTSTSKVMKTNSELEIQKYMYEICDMDQCPLTWWNEYGYPYRCLRTIAENYLCVPATVNNLFKKSINEQIDFYNKRKMLRTDVERSLLFLKTNKMN